MAGREEEAAFKSAMRLATGSVVTMALRSAIELDLLKLIKKCGEGKGASASQLAALLPTTNPNAADMIDRILRLLAAHSVLTCTLHKMADGGVERRYSLAPVCNYFISNEDGVSLAPIPLCIQHKVMIEPWYHMSDVILEGGVPFERAHGMNPFAYGATDPKFSVLLNQSMHHPSTFIMKRIVEIYKGFEGLKSLVDVGGGTGASSKLIVSKFPSIKAISFDLPHVIQHASPHPGVEYIGGDMFVEVPKADAILLKWVCHNWDDTHCLKLLKNCYEALPKNGKVILSESILSEDPHSEGSVYVSISDVQMLIVSSSGRVRTEKEIHSLAMQAGFKKFIKVCEAFDVWIMELHKSN